MTDLVSVIIPTFKRADTLGRSIESCLTQSYTNIEIIVVDDNDPETADRKRNENLMKNYSACTNIKYIKHDKNKNGAAARNSGIRASLGKYIAFLDDDDEFYDRKIERQIEKLESNPSLGGVYCNFEKYMSGKKINETKNRLDEDEKNLIFRILSNSLVAGFGSTLVVRKELVDKINGFDERFKRHQDLEFIIRILRITEVGLVADVLVRINSHVQNNIPNGKSFEETKMMYLEKFREDISKFPLREQNLIYKQAYGEVALIYMKNKEFSMGIKTLLETRNWGFLNFKDIIFIFGTFVVNALPIKGYVHTIIRRLKINI